MSQSRFVSKQFASLDLEGGNLTSNSNALEYINCDPPTVSGGIPIFSDETGTNVEVSALSVNSMDSFCMMYPTDEDADGIGMSIAQSAIILFHSMGYDVAYLQSTGTFLASNAVALPVTTVSQATSITTGVSAQAYPIIKITTQTTSLAPGASASFTVTGNTSFLTTPFAGVTVIPTVTSYSGSAIPYVIVSGYTNTTFTLKVCNIHPSNTLTQSMEISCTVLTNGNLLAP